MLLLTDEKEECGGQVIHGGRGPDGPSVGPASGRGGFALATETTKRAVSDLARANDGHVFDARDQAGHQDSRERSLAAPVTVLDSKGQTVGLPDVIPEGV